MSSQKVAYLRVLCGSLKGGVFVLRNKGSYLLGSNERCQIIVSGDPKIAEQHGRIVQAEDGVWSFQNLDSLRGSKVNDIRTDHRPLKPHDVIRIGSTEMAFSFDPPTPSAATSSEAGASAASPELSDYSAARSAEASVESAFREAAAEAQGSVVTATREGEAASPAVLKRQEGTGFFDALPPMFEDEVHREKTELDLPQLPAMAAAVIKIVVIDGNPDDIGREFLFSQDEDIVIGRSLSADVVLMDGKISRNHVRIQLRDNHLLLIDMGSSNGTVVNGESVKKTVLRPGDYVRLGFTVLGCQDVDPSSNA